MGIIYQEQGEDSKALGYYQRSLKIYHEIGVKNGSANTGINIANIYNNQGDHTKAMDYYQRSLKIHLGF